MSSYDKVVKGATKPKSGGIKPKYIDPIIATTFATDGSLQDVCRALGSRLKEPNATVVLKTLVILHTMIRNGEVDNVLGYLSTEGGNIRLRNVASGSWSGYSAPQTLSVYAQYLDERVRAYRDLKHDVIRSSDRSRAHSNGASNSNRLRKLSVEKGLLREVSTTQKVASYLMQCSFFLDDLNDDLVMSAFRMTLKDLLAIYTAINEGVINILEHYFEMAKTDAERALELYRRFCRQTENVVAFLNSAKKASHSLNLAIPSLKHAPVSLAGALEEYLKDPNFEQNRTEYKENKRIADGAPPSSSTRPISTIDSSIPKSESKKSITIQEPDKPERKVKPPTANQDLQDFFASIDNDGGHQMFSNIPAEHNFFVQAQPTGMMGINGAFGGMGMGYGTGMGGLQPQMTGYNPFMAQQQTGMQMPIQQQMAGFGGMANGGGMQPQTTGFLQPQATGFNPFRQSVMPQDTGFSGPFGAMNGQWGFLNQQQHQSQPQQQPQQQRQQQAQQQSEQQQTQFQQQQNQFQQELQPQHIATPAQPQISQQAQNQQSSALSNFNSAYPSVQNSNQSSFAASKPAESKPLLAQKTGSRNPFAPPPGSTPPPTSPPAPKGPSLNQLAVNALASPGGGHYGLGANAWDGSDPTGKNPISDQPQQGQGRSVGGSLAPQKTGLIGSIASEFAMGSIQNQSTSGATSPAPAAGGSNTHDLSSQFGAMSFSTNSLQQEQPQQQPQQQQQQQQQMVQPQPTGFGGSTMKPFKPESSFGASLASNPAFSLPPAGSAGGSGGVASQMTGNPFGAGPISSPGLQQIGNSGAGAGSLSAFNSAFSSIAPQQPSSSGFTTNAAWNGVQSQSNQTATPNAFGNVQSGIQAHPTGFSVGSSVKPFQPSSNFGKQMQQESQPNLLQF